MLILRFPLHLLMAFLLPFLAVVTPRSGDLVWLFSYLPLLFSLPIWQRDIFFFTASLRLHPSDPCLARDPVWSVVPLVFSWQTQHTPLFCDLDDAATVLALTNLDYSILQRALYFCRILSGRGRDVIFLQI